MFKVNNKDARTTPIGKIVLGKKEFVSVKIIFIGLISMLPCFNQNGVCYVYI